MTEEKKSTLREMLRKCTLRKNRKMRKQTAALLHGQRRIAGNAVQTRGDVRCSLSGRVCDSTASNYSSRGIRRGPLHIRSGDLRGRIAESNRGCEGLPQTKRYGRIGGCYRDVGTRPCKNKRTHNDLAAPRFKLSGRLRSTRPKKGCASCSFSDSGRRQRTGSAYRGITVTSYNCR
jgi:hypothetical protein